MTNLHLKIQRKVAKKIGTLLVSHKEQKTNTNVYPKIEENYSGK